ncbi:MAG: XdhC family protein [Planctomycetota bacterium]
MNMEFLTRLAEAIASGRGVVMATVVEVKGSGPREAGARMLVFGDGSIAGTVGGGAIEKRVVEEAENLLNTGKEGETRFFSFNLKEDLGMECGGETKVFLEAVKSLKRLVIFGGGHIGKALYDLSPLLGMAPVMVDARAEFCSTERFPHAERFACTPEQAAEKLCLGARDHVVIVTHRHLNDYDCLRLVVEYPVAYIGMIGSRQKVSKTLKRLRDDGVPAETIKRVCAPVGLNLGGRSPGEIAISIAAEIISIAQGKERDGFLWS